MVSNRATWRPDLRSLLRLLAGKVRLDLLRHLASGPMDVSTLAKKVGGSMATISHALNQLRQSGLVEMQQDAQRRVYRLSPLIRARRHGSKVHLRIAHDQGSEVQIEFRAKSARRSPRQLR